MYRSNHDYNPRPPPSSLVTPCSKHSCRRQQLSAKYNTHSGCSTHRYLFQIQPEGIRRHERGVVPARERGSIPPTPTNPRHRSRPRDPPPGGHSYATLLAIAATATTATDRCNADQSLARSLGAAFQHLQ